MGLALFFVYGQHIHMIELDAISDFEWDAGNARKNADKHSVSQSEAEAVFFHQPLLVLPDPRHSEQEPRFHALGQTQDGRRLHITFTLRAQGSLIRIISARDMYRTERSLYD
jgi:uncharacterized DUF497 family protein